MKPCGREKRERERNQERDRLFFLFIYKKKGDFSMVTRLIPSKSWCDVVGEMRERKREREIEIER